MSDAFDVIIGVGIGLLLLFILLCGCGVCNDPTPSTENSRIQTRNNTLHASHKEIRTRKIVINNERKKMKKPLMVN